MKYRIVITTDGRPGVLERTLASFDFRVRPRPVDGLIVDDSGDMEYRRYLTALCDERRWMLASHSSRLGFCQTVADAWTLAGEPGPRWIFWTEDDFEFRRAVNLVDLAHVLDCEPQVAQMALYRNPVSAEEKAAGGYLKLYPDAYMRRGAGTMAWLETQRNWTTNPSLFQRSLTALTWPTVDECEGRFGIRLRERRPETTFGIWGAGDPWVRHFGERAGVGY